jgi:hypothetical protein
MLMATVSCGGKEISPRRVSVGLTREAGMERSTRVLVFVLLPARTSGPRARTCPVASRTYGCVHSLRDPTVEHLGLSIEAKSKIDTHVHRRQRQARLRAGEELSDNVTSELEPDGMRLEIVAE